MTFQKKVIRIITFSDFRAHTSPLFKRLNLLKLPDIVYLNTALFMHHYNNGNLPDNFNDFFTSVSTRHQYRIRLASKSTFSLPQARTNYGKFNITFIGPKTWNAIEEIFKSVSRVSFKDKLKRK